MHACYFDRDNGEFTECDYEQPDCIGCKYEARIAASVTWYCLWCGKEHSTRPTRVRHFCDWTCKDNWTSAICNRWIGGALYQKSDSMTTFDTTAISVSKV